MDGGSHWNKYGALILVTNLPYYNLTYEDRWEKLKVVLVFGVMYHMQNSHSD